MPLHPVLSRVLPRAFPRPGAALAASTLALVLSACGGSSDSDSPAPPPDPLHAYRSQALSWQACDPTILGDQDAAEPEDIARVWQALGERLQCTWMRVPLDWAVPEKGDLSVALMRVRSAQPAQRQGTLFFNPGGPGHDGLRMALLLHGSFNKSNPATAQGALQLRLLDHYDMVGFSPRGMGASTNALCASNEFLRRVSYTPAGLSESNFANARYNAALEASACARSPLTPHIHTEATAHDLDLMRHLLGDSKLNYLGYSYGTWLGAWYASVFPERVGRMVLDSAVDYASRFESTFLAQPNARQRAHTQVLLPYATRHSQHFGLGQDPAAIDASLLQLPEPLQDVLVRVLADRMYSRTTVDQYLHTILAAEGLHHILRQHPDSASPETLEDALQAYTFLPGQPENDALVRKAAELLLQGYVQNTLNNEPPTSFRQQSIYWSVRCNDDEATTDDAQWQHAVRTEAERSPLFFGAHTINVCATWGGPRVRKPAIRAMQEAPVLLVQSQYDTATPAEGAHHFFQQLPRAQRVYVPGEYTHGVFPYADDCVDGAVTRYLLGASLAQRELQCSALPLEHDAPDSTAQNLQDSRKARTTPTSNYLDPAGAQAWRERYKDAIVPPTAPRR